MYKKFFLNSSIGSVILKIVNNDNPKLQLLDYNKSFKSILGKNDPEIRNANFSQLIPEFEDIEFAILKGDYSKQYFRYYSVAKENNYIVEVDISDRDVLLLFKDIFEPEINSIKLKDTEKTFRSIFNNTADAIYIQNIKGEFLDVNSGALKMYGYEKNDLIGKTPEIISADNKNDLSKISELVYKAYNGDSQQFEFWGKRKNGEVFPKLVRLSAGYYFGKKVVLAYAIDITERKKERERIEFNLKLETLIRKISSYFIGVYDTKKSINIMLQDIGMFSNAYRSYVFVLGELKNNLTNLYCWCRRDSDCSNSHINDLTLSSISFWMEKLSKGEIVFVEDFSEMPEIPLKEDLIKNNIKSFVAVPLMKDNYFIGLTIFYYKNKIELFKEQIINLLNISSSIIENVVNRYAAEQKLKESESYNKVLFQKSHISFAVLEDETFKYIECNDAAVKIFGLKNEVELIGLTPLDFSCETQYNDENSITLFKEKTKEAIEKESVVFDWRCKRKSGELFDAQIHLVYITYQNKKLFQLYLFDITERRRIIEQNKKLSIAITQSPNTIVITNLKGDIEYVNPRFTEKTGYTYEEVIGKNPRILNSGVQSKEYYVNLWKTITSGKTWRGEFCNKTKSGKLFWELSSISPLINESNKIYGYLGIKEDITKRKENERKLIEHEKNLSIAVAAKNKFFSIIAHDLINPIGSIANFSELLQANFKEFDVEKQINYIVIIAQTARHTLNLLQDLLEWSRLQNKKIEFNFEVIDIKSLVDENFSLFQSNALSKNIMLISKVDENIKVFADKNAVNTVLRNLISNAIKFTENGSITVSLKVVGEFGEISVTDTGVGIPPERIEKLFKIEENVSTLGTAQEKGTGLGLIMCKNFVEGNNGEIRVESILGEGSSFIFTLPLIPM